MKPNTPEPASAGDDKVSRCDTAAATSEVLPETPKKPARVLIVDDEPSILSALKRIFRGEGYELLTAQSGKEGLALLHNQPVDIVISDMRMPEMDGAQFLEQVFIHWPSTKRILLTGHSDASSAVAAINRGKIWRYLAKPWDDEELLTTVKQALTHRNLLEENARLSALTQAQNAELKSLNASLEEKVAARTAQLQAANDSLHTSFVATVRVFSNLIEMREGRLAGHSRRVADLARQLAARLDLSADEERNVLLAALLHDIGKVGLPDKLIGRAFNALTPTERLEMMTHPAVGANFLDAIPQLKQAAYIIRHHHEAMDGSGYPDQLAGLSIPLGARILAVVNDYDSLQTGSLSLHPHSPKDAQELIRQQRGKRYDPRVVDAFLGMVNPSDPSKPAGAHSEAITRPSASAPRWHEVSMSTDKLRDGMRLARDLRHHQHGYLLLAGGLYLDDIIIRQLREIEAAEEYSIQVPIRVDNH